MAAGDITSVKELGRIALPGGGNTLTGVQVQNKVLVWGQIIGSWVTTGMNPAAAGSPLGASGTLAKTFGVENIDFCELTVHDEGAAPQQSKDAMHFCAIDRGSDLIFGLESMGDGTRGDEFDDDDILDLRYLVVGDASAYTELT